jgi:hypothetical protein
VIMPRDGVRLTNAGRLRGPGGPLRALARMRDGAVTPIAHTAIGAPDPIQFHRIQFA